MSDRNVTRAAPWFLFVALVVVLQLVASCGQDAVTLTESSSAVIAETADTSAVEVVEAPDGDASQVTAATLPPTGRPELLSEWAQLHVSNGQLVLGDDVVPYELNSALFSDYAHKLRTVWLPDGSEPAAYQADEVFDFPVGTVITKTFYFPVETDAQDGQVLKVTTAAAALAAPLDLSKVRLLETRVLVHREDGWQAWPYMWNHEQTEATLQRTGGLIPLTLVDQTGTEPFVYVVPDVNQCANCHATNHTTGLTQPIGPKARHLNTKIDLGDGPVSQLVSWQGAGLLGETPPAGEIPMAVVWDDDSMSLADRARAYLDINCSHCHNSTGSADTSGLFLEPMTELGFRLGVCKGPVAAGKGTGGRLVGIKPGEPDESIFVYRMETLDPGAMMPEVGRALMHTEGVDLISSWIDSLEGSC